MSVPGLFKTPWVKCISKALPKGVKDQMLSSLYSLLLSSFAISSLPIESSSANPETILICRGKSRAWMCSSLCTALSSTKPSHTKGRSEPLPFHASNRPGPRDRILLLPYNLPSYICLHFSADLPLTSLLTFHLQGSASAKPLVASMHEKLTTSI